MGPSTQDRACRIGRRTLGSAASRYIPRSLDWRCISSARREISAKRRDRRPVVSHPCPSRERSLLEHVYGFGTTLRRESSAPQNPASGLAGFAVADRNHDVEDPTPHSPPPPVPPSLPAHP